MKPTTLLTLTLGLLPALTLSVFAQGTERFVAQDGQTPVHPYISWANAASNIQDAVTAAAIGDTVIIRAGQYVAPTNGIVHNDYGAITNVVFLNKPMTLRSESRKSSDVIIDGQGAYRAIAVNYNSHSTTPFVFEGLTITNSWNHGIRIGGGNLRNWTNEVSNCVITHTASGDGIYNGAAFGYWVGLTVTRTTLRHNAGYGIQTSNSQVDYAFPRIRVEDCLIERNATGAISFHNGYMTMSHCIVRNHNIPSGGVLTIGNGANDFYNNLIYHNVTDSSNILNNWGSTGWIEFHSSTFVSNLVTGGFGTGFRGGKTSRIYNSIIRYNYNNATIRDVWSTNLPTFTNSNSTGTMPGSGNISSNPLFVDFEGGNFRLTRESPCVNTGYNLPWMDNAVDLDGRRRIDAVVGTVDMGAFEYQYAGTTILVR